MKTHTFANVIIQDLSSQSHLHDNFEISRGIISELVEGWNKNLYVIPNQALNLYSEKTKKYLYM